MQQYYVFLVSRDVTPSQKIVGFFLPKFGLFAPDNLYKTKTKTKTVYWNIKTTLMSSTQCKDTKSYKHVNEHTTGRNILTENYHIHNKKMQR